MYGLRIDSATLTIYCSERLLSYRIDNIIAIATKIVQNHPLHVLNGYVKKIVDIFKNVDFYRAHTTDRGSDLISID